MATSTPIDSEVALLVPFPGEVAASQPIIFSPGAPMEKTRSYRHTQLHELLQRLAAMGCPADLRNDQDDIAQKVLIRLVEKLEAFEARLRRWLETPQEDRGAERLQQCLTDITTFGDQTTCRELCSSLKRCLAIVEHKNLKRPLGRAVKRLRRHFAKFQTLDGQRLIASYYVRKSMHWAIQDERKRRRRLAEDQIEDDQVGLSKPHQVHHQSLPHQIAIRHAIRDGLANMPDHYRETTILDLQGYQVPEVAQLLDLNIRQAESRVRRGREKLRECLSRKGVTPW